MYRLMHILDVNFKPSILDYGINLFFRMAQRFRIKINQFELKHLWALKFPTESLYLRSGTASHVQNLSFSPTGYRLSTLLY